MSCSERVPMSPYGVRAAAAILDISSVEEAGLRGVRKASKSPGAWRVVSARDLRLEEPLVIAKVK